MKRTFALLVVAGFFLLAGCNGSSTSALMLVIDEPSVDETNFAEKRDFYVIGSYSSEVTAPGDIQIELYRGDPAVGDVVRRIRSHVDFATGVTLESDLNLDYDQGSNFGVTMVPDLVETPGGFLDPTNKVVVTTTYFAGMILGGVTKDFDTSYTDEAGEPLEDLTEGVYTIVVRGLNGDVAGLFASKEISFGLTHASLGRFSPTSSLDKLIAFTAANDYRIYLDRFPGYFALDGNLYEIKNRWMPNNAIEVTNDLTGTVVDTVASAYNDMLVYNVRDTSATNTVETAALVRFELTESDRTVFHYYDIGEPTITYTTMTGGSNTLDGNYAPFAAGDVLVLTRAEVQDAGEVIGDNLYRLGDTTPKDLDLDLSDGIEMTVDEAFSLFGVVRPIPATVTPGEHSYEFSIDDRVAEIRYTVKDEGGATVETSTHEVDLERAYDPSSPDWLSGSVYEFKHDLTIDDGVGRYTVELVGLDESGAEVEGTNELFTVDVSA